MGGDEEVNVVIQGARVLGHAEVQAALDSELGAISRLPVLAVVVERLPRNNMGKVKRAELRRQLAEVMRAGMRARP